MIALYVLAFIIAALLFRRRHRHIDMHTVRRLELERYMGRWYEIARYDRLFERPLRNVEARYTLRPDGQVVMERAGIDSRTGRRRTSRGHAERTHRSGRLRVRAFGLFHTGYYVLELDDDYEWALVGRSTPLRLHILSRQPHMRRETLRHIVGLAERRGYPLDRLRLLRAPQ
ncbi:lipocalin family protein [Alistipes sp.]|uniref:lipocalin family protein n=1 Tax=Alistipes sp. TaxID=1872444 RepID=UPI003A85D339